MRTPRVRARRIAPVVISAMVVYLSTAGPSGAAGAHAVEHRPSQHGLANQTDGPFGALFAPPPGVGLSPEVAAVPASSPELTAATAALADLEQRRQDDSAALTRDAAQLLADTAESASVRSLARRRSAQLDKAAEVAERTRGALRQLTVDRFVEGDHLLEGLDPALSAEQRDALGRQMVLAEVGSDVLLDEQSYTSERRDQLADDLHRLEEHAAELDLRTTRLSERTTALESSLAELGPRILDAQRRRDVARMSASIDGTDLSATALDAYWRAERYLAARQPDCGVTWWALAGIGRTESRHGTYRGATLGTDGRVDPPIYGPELDGSNRFAIVPDSDGGRLDATAATDRAVGPMQFLPGTWGVVGTDLDGDGTADPQNLFDAATSAGVYLCRSGPGLTDESRLRAAILTYNRSPEYVEIVVERADGYAAAVPLR